MILQNKSFLSLGQYLSIGLTVSMITILSQAVQAATPTFVSADLLEVNSATHKIAVLQVLSEICPPMLNTRQKHVFYQRYNIELQKLIPNIENPQAALQYLSTQQDYKNILRSIRIWTKGYPYPAEENKILCQELASETF
ncbi:MCR_0457 family protein [Psychrobacter sp. I-STPA6b]|uniref:MCR_0457 family protein n=1 Tax=Psychrobacter sp. I-STPA6b TaxID=2585718 RepID=UPI001D0C077E|nr:hypothetical protein [Psychrobacter sp. I-STPA6b]